MRPSGGQGAALAAAVPRWRTYLELGRVSNLPTVWSNVLAGVLVAKGPLEPSLLAALLSASSLFYVGGMYLNDAFDRHVDARVRPERPIPSGRISAVEVFAIGFGMLAAALGLLLWNALASGRPGGLASVGSGGALAGAIVLYDAWHKGNPISPFLMGVCRMLVYVTGALAASGRVDGDVVGAALSLLAYLIGLTYVAKQESFSEVKNLWPLLFLLAPFVYCGALLLREPTAAMPYVAFATWVVYSVRLVVQRQIGRAVVSLIAGISLLDATLIAVAGSLSAAAAACGAFGATLFLQRFVRGT